MKDNDIIRGIRENSEMAWRMLYSETHGKFAPLITRLLAGNSSTTFDDIYELACLDLMENVKSGRLVESESGNLSGYLYTICWRRAVRVNGSRVAEEKLIAKMEPGSAVFNPDVDFQADMEAEDAALAFLDEVFKTIPERCRKILRRFYWDKMPMKDIAAAMGLKNSDVAKATKNQCMEKFKKVAKAMLADDKSAEAAVRRTIERDALRDLLEECRKESSGEWKLAAMDEEKE